MTFTHPQYRHDGHLLDPTTVRAIAKEAVRARLGSAYVDQYGIHGSVQEVDRPGDGAVWLHVNSGGNAAAVRAALANAGYLVTDGPRPDYGILLAVTGSTGWSA